MRTASLALAVGRARLRFIQARLWASGDSGWPDSKGFQRQSLCAMRHVSERQVIREMKVALPLSHEIRYVFSVHGGILIAGVAILHRNVFLMAKLRLGSYRLCAHASVGTSRHSFPAMVTKRRGDCPAWAADRTTQPRRLLQNVDRGFEERSRANLRPGVEQRFIPGTCCVPGGDAGLHALRSSQLSSGTASGLLRRPAAPRSSASTGPPGLGLPKQIERPERAPACREISFGSLRES